MNTLTRLADADASAATAPGVLRLDALSDIFLQLGRHYNTNSNQIVVVEGMLDIERLDQAVRMALAQFPSLLRRTGRQRGWWRSADFTVRDVEFDGTCDLADPRFRSRLMALSDSARIDWRKQPATQIFLIRSADRQRCCVYLNSAHAAADARSDCMLLSRIMLHYARGGNVPQVVAPAFEPLQSAIPEWYRPRARLRRLFSAMRDVAFDSLRKDCGYPVRHGSRSGYAPQEGAADFHVSMVPDSMMASIRETAKRCGVSVNTFFSAALVRAMEQRAQIREGMLRFSCVVSLRKLPVFGAQSRQASFGNHVVTCAIRQAAGRDASTLLRELHANIGRVRARRVPVELGRLELALPWMRLSCLQPLVRRMMARAQATNVCYSNPGVIDEDFSCFGDSRHPVLQYTGLGCLVTPYDLMLYTTTVNGHTQLDVLYRKACFTDIEAELIAPLHTQIRRLLDELSLPASISRTETGQRSEA
jgi:NRPS condensation-like uncharacterized protein